MRFFNSFASNTSSFIFDDDMTSKVDFEDLFMNEHFALVTSSQKRKRNRESLSNEKRSRFKKTTTLVDEKNIEEEEDIAKDMLNTSKSTIEKDEVEKYRQFDQLVRWKIFLYASHKNFDVIIKEIFDDNLKSWNKRY